MHAARSAPARQSSTVDLVAMLLVLAGDHQASANANAKILLRLAEHEPLSEAPHNANGTVVEQRPAVA